MKKKAEAEMETGKNGGLLWFIGIVWGPLLGPAEVWKFPR